MEIGADCPSAQEESLRHSFVRVHISALLLPWGSRGLGWGLGCLPCVLSVFHVDRAACFPPRLQCLLFQLPAGSGFEAVPGLFGAVCKPQSLCWAPGSSPVCCWCSLDCHSCIPGAQGHFSLFGKQQGSSVWPWCCPGVSLFANAPWFSHQCVSPADPAALPEGDPALAAGPCLAVPLWEQGQTGAEHGQVRCESCRGPSCTPALLGWLLLRLGCMLASQTSRGGVTGVADPNLPLPRSWTSSQEIRSGWM